MATNFTRKIDRWRAMRANILAYSLLYHQNVLNRIDYLAALTVGKINLLLKGRGKWRCMRQQSISE